MAPLIAWIVVVVGVGGLLAGWALGVPGSGGALENIRPGAVAIVLALVVLACDVLRTRVVVPRRRRREQERRSAPSSTHVPG